MLFSRPISEAIPIAASRPLGDDSAGGNCFVQIFKLTTGLSMQERALF
jgi:hypothetical protein